MGFLDFLLGICEFGVGTSLGLVFGYFFFFYFRPTDAKDIIIPPFEERYSSSSEQLILELPSWVKNPDYDRVDWLNQFVEIIWPYLDKAIWKRIEDTLKSYILDYLQAYKIESVDLKTLTLGSLPPTFHGMKVYITNEKEVIMEPSLKWAGNSVILMKIKAFGLSTTVEVADFQFFTTPRITLKPLVPSFPCFAKAFVSLMDKPYVDFGLKLVGADVMSIPGINNFVQDIVKDQVLNMCLWPRTLTIPIMDPTKALRKPVGILYVKVVRASNLKKKDLMGKSDPYVKLKLTEEKLPSKKTSVKHNNLNPEWNEEFKMVVKDPESQELMINVFDWEQVSKHDYMGMNIIALKDLTPDERKTYTLDLLKNTDPAYSGNKNPRGQIVLDVVYRPFKQEELSNHDTEDSNVVEKAPDGTPSSGGLLVVIIHEAEDVEGKHHTNPYALVLFRGNKRKTKRMKKNRNPKWEEEFQFVVDDPPQKDKLHVEVLSKPKFIGLPSKENLGYVDINLADAVTNKRINQKYHLIESTNGKIQIEIQWKT